MKHELQDYSLEELAVRLQSAGCSMTVPEVFLWLRHHGYIIGGVGELANRPSDLAVAYGLMRLDMVCSSTPEGDMDIHTRPMLTESGMAYIMPRIAATNKYTEGGTPC